MRHVWLATILACLVLACAGGYAVMGSEDVGAEIVGCLLLSAGSMGAQWAAGNREDA